MYMNTAIPHLSTEGFITIDNIKLIKVFEHFLASEYSQSNTYAGQIGSLKYLLEHFSTESELKTNIVRTLTEMYNKYFKSVDVNVNIIENDINSIVKVNIDVTVIGENDKAIGLNRELTYVDNVISNFDLLAEEMNS